MITNNLRFPAFALLSVAALACGAHRADAFSMNTYVQSISQSGFTAGVNLGHTVSASSDLNRLYAAGAFEASCASSYTGSIHDQRGFSAQSLIFGTRVSVTVPELLPAQLNMPGFDQVPGGTTLSCIYNWTADAEESTYTVSVQGLAITVGGQKAHDGRSVPFEMYQPGGDGNKSNGCIH
jgi:hypothetical protein